MDSCKIIEVRALLGVGGGLGDFRPFVYKKRRDFFPWHFDRYNLIHTTNVKEIVVYTEKSTNSNAWIIKLLPNVEFVTIKMKSGIL